MLIWFNQKEGAVLRARDRMLDRRQALFALAGASATAAMGAQAQATPPPPLQGFWCSVEEAARALIARRLTPGFQLCVSRGDEVLFSGAYGHANLETDTLLGPDSVMRIGSVTKQFTAAAMLLLEADGALQLSDKLGRFLPSFPGASEITLERMLNHTSGLSNFTGLVTTQEMLQESRRDNTMAERVSLLANSAGPLVFEPGTSWAYSNTAYVLLAAVIEAVTGAGYGRFFSDRLFQPSGMTATAVDNAADVVARRASGYSHAGAALGFSNASFIAMSYPGAAGSVRSTARDLCKWSAALLGGRVLSASGLEKMLTPARLTDGSEAAAGGPSFRSGLGQRLTDIGGRRVVRHGGGIQGFSCDLWSLVDTGVTTAAIVNCDGHGEDQARNQALATDALAILDLIQKALADGQR